MAGYDAVAERMAQYPEIAIFRRFRFLHAKTILLLQAELVLLEDELKLLTELGHEPDGCEDPSVPSELRVNKCWESSREEATPLARSHKEKVLEIRKTLSAYCKLPVRTGLYERC